MKYFSHQKKGFLLKIDNNKKILTDTKTKKTELIIDDIPLSKWLPISNETYLTILKHKK